ncbi:MAG: T9SS type A sorting domain-containing protein [Flavobacteriales bacterium]|nr:T9SS type A sorting domain-containing protein [Flavobacteriales bacterium]MCB0758741.1 T9SS type A sorting domain-containing protein [Flavobacteriales bacterium]
MRSTMRNWTTTLLLSLAAISGPVEACAQEHPFLSAYALTELPDGVLVNWTIHGGSTCDGQEVQRSTDSLHFSVVHTIQGICGSPDASTPYTWFDPSPPELSRAFYRLKLGFDGYSSVKSVFFAQLNASEQRFFPNPASNVATLVVDAKPNTPLDLSVFDGSGRLVVRLTGVNGPTVDVPVRQLPAGLYTYRVSTVAGRSFSGRFAKR